MMIQKPKLIWKKESPTQYYEKFWADVMPEGRYLVIHEPYAKTWEAKFWYKGHSSIEPIHIDRRTRKPLQDAIAACQEHWNNHVPYVG